MAAVSVKRSIFWSTSVRFFSWKGLNFPRRSDHIRRHLENSEDFQRFLKTFYDFLVALPGCDLDSVTQSKCGAPIKHQLFTPPSTELKKDEAAWRLFYGRVKKPTWYLLGCKSSKGPTAGACAVPILPPLINRYTQHNNVHMQKCRKNRSTKAVHENPKKLQVEKTRRMWTADQGSGATVGVLGYASVYQ